MLVVALLVALVVALSSPPYKDIVCKCLRAGALIVVPLTLLLIAFIIFEGTTRQRAQISFGNCSLMFPFIAYFKWYISISLILRWRACSGFFEIASDSWRCMVVN